MNLIDRLILEPVERVATTHFTRGRRRIAGASAFAAVCGIGFTAIGLFNRHRFGLLETPPVHAFWLDALIPFEPGWVWVYVLYYPFCFLPLFLKQVRVNPSVFLRTMVMFGLQFAISFAMFLLIPLRVSHGVLPMGVTGEILGALYGFDLGFNSFPSLHLANITAVTFLYYRFSGRWRAAAVLLGALLIAASTMLVKQHFVSDVLLGILLGWASFAAMFSTPETLSSLSPAINANVSTNLTPHPNATFPKKTQTQYR